MSGAVTAHAVSAVSASGGVMVRPGGAPLLARGGLELGQMISERARRALSTSSAVEVAAGPGNTLWFTNGGETVGRITTTGKVAVFSEPQHLRGTYGITRGPDGAMWFTNYLASSIGRIDATGAIVTFTAPCVRYPMGITAGADGAMWFADDSGSIGRITSDGNIRCYGDVARVGHPGAIIAGGDGALWAADRSGSIVRVTTRGVVTRYTTAGMRFPDRIAAGPNRAVWFTDYLADAVGRIGGSGRPTKPSNPRPLPRVTLLSDSAAASIVFDTGAKSLLANGIDLFLEPGQGRTLGPQPLGVTGPPTLPDLITQLGSRLGQTVVVDIGHNDTYSDRYASDIDAALAAFHAAGVKRVLWTTLHVTTNHWGFTAMNDAVVAAAAQHPELTIVDWNAYAAPHPEWFQRDGVHLIGDGPRALARCIHGSLIGLGVPLTARS